jgi:hypothetical protein
VSDLSVPRDGDAGRVERQVERASFFTHTALSAAAQRQHVTESLLMGLVDVLLARSVVTEEEVEEAARLAQRRLEDEGEAMSPRLAVRVDPDPPPAPKKVDCEDRWPVCHGVCCRLSFALTLPEVESGQVRWDLGQPYHIRQEEDGACTHQDRSTGACSIYEHRPGICRTYSCAADERIWLDFDAKILNQPWIDEHLSSRSVPVAIAPRRLMQRPGDLA